MNKGEETWIKMCGIAKQNVINIREGIEVLRKHCLWSG